MRNVFAASVMVQESGLLAVVPLDSSAALAATVRNEQIHGKLRNPHGRIDGPVTPRKEGDRVAVIRASSKTVAEANDARIMTPARHELLQDYHLAASGHWAGLAYVPDKGRRVSSHGEQVESDQLRISGSLWRGRICDVQLWRWL